MAYEDEHLCGIDGIDTEPVLIGKFNRWAARAVRMHVSPMKDDLKDLKDYVAEEKLEHAKIQGGIKALLWVVPVGNIALLFVLYLMNKAGIF